MALKPCTECGNRVAETAEKCPNCGVEHPTSPRARNVTGVLKFVMVILLIALAFFLWKLM